MLSRLALPTAANIATIIAPKNPETRKKSINPNFSLLT